ncbi:MAG: tetratricopeptide repeat protein [Bacteroidetes bacterium]|nr:tetratricopeptide repeat protein [Bacteroidota bacterium]
MKKYILILFIFLTSCSQFSKSPTSKVWHNLNARYNALLIAREDYKEAGFIIKSKQKENFDQILPIFPKIDSNKLDSAKFYLIDAIKKSSIIAERHSNSKYLDEAYLILGKSRLLKQEYFNAIETFKYVNTKARSEQKKTEALIWLMRSYIENQDINSANQVGDIIKNRKLNNTSKAEYLLTRAYLHQKLNESNEALILLEEGLKYIGKSPNKARYNFVCGQLHESLGNNLAARKYYRNVLKSKPEYEMAFNAQLGLLSSESLANNTNILFGEMLEDRKNLDNKGMIFQKMAQTEARKKNYKEAIGFYNQSIANAGDNAPIKAGSYQAIADIYLDVFQDYEKAGNYYDSTIVTLPKNESNFDKLSLKALNLNEFIRFKKAYDLEDSLQMLSALSNDALETKLFKMVEARKAAEKKSEMETAAKTESPKVLIPSNQKDRWVLYDPVESVKSKNDFIRNWGNRPLEDNWRRSEKTMGSFSLKIEKTILETGKPVENQKESETLTENEDLEKKAINEEVKEMMRKIPRSNVQILASKRKQEEALFQIGKIYAQKFGDNLKAKIYYQKLINEHPRSIYEPEVLYFMTLDQQDPVNNVFAQKLITDHPYSSFTRQLKKGGQKFTKDKETEVAGFYSEVFKNYESGQYQEALKNLEEGLNKYLGSQIEDKLAMLRLLTLQKLGLKDQYVISLNDFLRSYPTSDLQFKARDFLEAVK